MSMQRLATDFSVATYVIFECRLVICTSAHDHEVFPSKANRFRTTGLSRDLDEKPSAN